jgi:hypothetical protein
MEKHANNPPRAPLASQSRRGRRRWPHRNRPALQLERLEDRCLLSASLFYSFDGTGNNISHADWGNVHSA